MALKSPISQLVQSVLTSLSEIDDVARYWVAFSGGIDSHVLLHVLASNRHQLGDVDLQAVHINHGLNIQSDQWAERCQSMCEQLKTGFVAIDVDATPRTGESPEARARSARYDAIARLIRPGDCLLTAHHQDDQVETLLLQLMRGSGPRGLAAMPEVANFESGIIARPLINVRRESIRSYAVKHQLKWIDDDSNQDTRFDRNFIRHEVIPRLQQRWPSLSQTVSRSARYCAEAAEILEASAREALAKINPEGNESLSVSGLEQYSRVEQKNIIRYWIHSKGLSTPSSVQLDQVIEQVLTAAVDATPRLIWEGTEVRRYRDGLYAFSPLENVDTEQAIEWNLDEPLRIENAGTLMAIGGRGNGIAKQYISGAEVVVSFRQGGESIQPAGRKEKHALKKLFQDNGVPPWIRERTPLIYIGDELAAVGEMFVSDKFHARDGEESFNFQWESSVTGSA